MTDATQRAAVAKQAARAGGELAKEMFRDEFTVETKTDKNDLVSEADRAAQQQVIATIAAEFPDATLVCEEDAEPDSVTGDVHLVEDVPNTGDAWVVDPIDGTGNFVRGIRFWATVVAAVTDGEAVGAATYLPVLGDIYTAGPESVSLNDQPIRVSLTDDPEAFAVGLNGWWPVHGGDEFTPLFQASIDSFGDVRRFGSMQGALALVASGSLDAAFMPRTPHPWDSIAGVCLIRRAGGTVTDIHGTAWTPDSDGLVVSNGQAHDTVLDVFQEVPGFS